MKTDGGWVSVSEAARLYGKSRKWVYDQIERYQIGTERQGNRTRLRLVDLITHRGEPPTSAPGNNENHAEHSQKITPENTHHAALLKQENGFLRRRIDELEADRQERQTREAGWEAERARLEGIIERQTYALPPAAEKGTFSRVLRWWTAR